MKWLIQNVLARLLQGKPAAVGSALAILTTSAALLLGALAPEQLNKLCGSLSRLEAPLIQSSGSLR